MSGVEHRMRRSKGSSPAPCLMTQIARRPQAGFPGKPFPAMKTKKPAFPKRRKTGSTSIQPVSKKLWRIIPATSDGVSFDGRLGENRETIFGASENPTGHLPARYSSRYARRRSRTKRSINSGKPESRNSSKRQGASETSARRSSFTTYTQADTRSPSVPNTSSFRRSY